MKYCKIAIVISIIILGGIAAIVIFLIANDCFQLTDHEKIQNITGIFASCGALISAVILLCSFKQTNSAFILSTKPALLIRVCSIANQNEVPLTAICYDNTTSNSFEDLTMKVYVSNGSGSSREVIVFNNPMHMPGHDSRVRIIETATLLDDEDDTVKLKINYSFTFLGIQQEYKGQEYELNKENHTWSII